MLSAHIHLIIENSTWKMQTGEVPSSKDSLMFLPWKMNEIVFQEHVG